MSAKFRKFFRKSLLCATLCPGLASGDEAARQHYEKEILPIFVNYCYDCHGDGSSEGHLELDKYGSIEEMIADRGEWQKIRDAIDFRLMPPPDEYAPKDDERAKLVKWIDDAVFHVDPANPDPGRVILKRMNRVEYSNTVRDLLGVDVNVTEILPVDDSGYGFDNIGDVLTLSPLHMERYLEASRVALDAAIDLSPPRFPSLVIKPRQLKGDGDDSGDGRYFTSSGKASMKLRMRSSGTYRFHVSARADEAGDEAAKLEMRINDSSVAVWDVSGNGDTFSFEQRIEGGQEFEISAAFLNDFYLESGPEGKRDRNLMVEKIVMEGPVDGQPLEKSASHRTIYVSREGGQSDEDYLDKVVGSFANRAFRRPVSDEEVKRYRFFLDSPKDDGQGVEYAIHQALSAVMVSPSFLFREESVQEGDGGGKVLIDEHALASRLSYFLWSTMPDDRLRDLADKGELRKNLQEEIRRMLDSGKSEEFVKNFVGQWLQLRDMDNVSPNKMAYGEFDKRLWQDMRTESEMLFKQVMKENLPVQTLLSADYTFINERLANHYGISGVQGDQFRQVSLKDTPRRGLLGQGSFLTMTSHTNRTSPVLRGKYVLENILNTPPPPAPPNVPSLGNQHGKDGLSLRQELEQHRKDPVCASCHSLMDPIGFGLENYDGVGRWRDQDRGKPIDTADKLVTGQNFNNSVEMRDIIIRDYKKEFHRAVAVKMLTYAMGRGVEYYDRPAIDEILLKAGRDDGRFISWITAVAESVPFQYRRK